ncbi:MAG TPA: LysM peptidoglycan-binding domain-containing protein, partial [Candidatus Ozemobacteraceae bacterium]|nr:LysM peptidoglycan-binding domain-containing protein [Candidatus Ozemobacteraceae bacterium]
MNKQGIGVLLVTSLLFSQASTKAEIPFSGDNVQVTNDGGTVMINGALVPANAGAGSESAAQSYTVRSGDSLSQIARQCLGDGDRYMEIVNLNVSRYPSLRNNPDLIYPGWTLALPAGAQTSASSNTSGGTGSYTVRSGDSLSQIARQCLG